jgi:hypothetical protein
VFGVPCTWVRDAAGAIVCSACASIEENAADPAGRNWLRMVIANAATEQFTPYEPCAVELAARQGL